MSETETYHFGGNRRVFINNNYLHAVKVMPYTTRTTKDGFEVKAEKSYVAHGFEDSPEGVWVRIKVGDNQFTEVNLKCLEYVGRLRKK